MAKTIAVSILADTKELAKNLSSAEGDLKSFGSEADSQADKARLSLDSVAEGADNTASATAQAAGGLGDLGGALQLLPGPLAGIGAGMEAAAPAIMGVTGAADLANVATEKLGISTIKAKVATVSKMVAEKAGAVATKAMAIAQAALNAVMSANPIALVVIALVLLVAAFVLAYKKSETFRRIVDGAMGGVLAVVKKVMGFVTHVIPAAFATVINWIKSHWKIVAVLIGGPIALAVLAIKAHFNDIKAGISNVISFIRGVPGKIRGLVGNFKAAGSALMHALIDGLKNAAGAVGDIGRAIADSLISFLNGVLPHSLNIDKGPIHINVPLFPTIPHLASGGIATRATLALIGEAGPEAVVPLDKGFGNTVNVYVTAPVGSSSTDIGREIDKHLKKYWGQAGYRP